jgi:hypothetical protein
VVISIHCPGSFTTMSADATNSRARRYEAIFNPPPLPRLQLFLFGVWTRSATSHPRNPSQCVLHMERRQTAHREIHPGVADFSMSLASLSSPAMMVHEKLRAPLTNPLPLNGCLVRTSSQTFHAFSLLQTPERTRAVFARRDFWGEGLTPSPGT